MFARVQKLRQKGVLGINCRNGHFILQYNSRKLYPHVDDKLFTKRLAEEAGVPIPELYGVIESTGQIRNLHSRLDSLTDFVIKPARGTTGEGIIVITGRPQKLYRKISGQILEHEDLTHYVLNILSGMYSLGGHPDKALIEYRVRFDPVFKQISYQGVPDIRIVVLFGVPVMSMVRLPTQMSDGRANLHQGAIGAGIDIASGKTLSAVWQNTVVREHPDTGNDITGIQIPHWLTLLELAARCYELTGVAYQGVDIVLDCDKGPLLLEVNARPGLNIQIANNCGLLPRLRNVEKHRKDLTTIDERISFARSNFGTY